MRVFILISLYYILSVTGYCQDKETKDIIYWNKQTKLTWKDFQGIRPEHEFTDYGTEVMAASAVEIRYLAMILGKSISFKVYCRFVKNKSWTKDTISQKLLAHEQLHFDIGELYARKIRQKIFLLKEHGVKNYDIYKHEIDKLLAERDSTDIKYDKETLHGAIDFAQQEWNKKIEEELHELKDYAVNYDEYLKDN